MSVEWLELLLKQMNCAVQPLPLVYDEVNVLQALMKTRKAVYRRQLNYHKTC